jgi:hypothetical protein
MGTPWRLTDQPGDDEEMRRLKARARELVSGTGLYAHEALRIAAEDLGIAYEPGDGNPQANPSDEPG